MYDLIVMYIHIKYYCSYSNYYQKQLNILILVYMMIRGATTNNYNGHKQRKDPVHNISYKNS